MPSSPSRPARSTRRSSLSSSWRSAPSRAATIRRPGAAPTREVSIRSGLPPAASSSAPEKNTQAAALYLDILFSTYSDPQMVLAEYNGGPLNAGYFRAGVGPLAAETRNYVPRVLQLYARLKEEFDRGMELRVELMHRDARREGKTLA